MRRRGCRLSALADPKCVNAHRFGDVFQHRWPEIGDREIEPPSHLPKGILGQADRAGLGDSFQPRRDIDAVAHQIAVALLDDVAEMDADPKHNPLIFGGPDIPFGHRVLQRNRAAHRFDDASEFDQRPVAGALKNPSVLARDDGIDQVGAQRAQSRKSAIFVVARHPAKADNVRRQNRNDFAPLEHRNPNADESLTHESVLSLSLSQKSHGIYAPPLSHNSFGRVEAVEGSITLLPDARPAPFA